MQIDFHHTVTYVVARFAEFTHEEASTIAYCAQYVDDATTYGEIKFDNGSSYSYISSAHNMIDIRNAESLPNQEAWLPFHFLPGNEYSEKTFPQQAVCRENSQIAQDMVRDCILEKNRPYGLHRLGITMHVYADTWAHQKFAGMDNAVNEASEVEVDYQGNQNIIDIFIGFVLGKVMPLGHAAVNVYPDLPFLVWNYKNWRGGNESVVNPDRFMRAADNMLMAMQRYIKGDPDADVSGLRVEDRSSIVDMFNETVALDGKERHKQWLDAIKNGRFRFSADLQYIPDGSNSWKEQALIPVPIDSNAPETPQYECVYQLTPAFLESDWKLFHDALQVHRSKILDEILPKHGIRTT